MPVVRVRRDAGAGPEVASRSSTATTSRSSPPSTGMPAPGGRRGPSGDTSSPVQPSRDRPTAPPAPTAASRCSRTCSPRAPLGLTLKVDVDEAAARASRGWRCTRAPTGTSASAGRCSAFMFDGHPALRHLYLPSRVRGPSAAQGLPAAVAGREAVAGPRRRRADARRSAVDDAERPTDGAAPRESGVVSTTNPPLPDFRSTRGSTGTSPTRRSTSSSTRAT